MGIPGNREGTAPSNREGRNKSFSCSNCPDIFEVADPGELKLAGTPAMREDAVHLVVGTVVERPQLDQVDLPEGTSIAEYEGVVAVPDRVFYDAAVQLLQGRGVLDAGVEVPYVPVSQPAVA